MHTGAHAYAQELLGLYDNIGHSKKMGIVYGGNTVKNTVAGTSAERQGVKSGWRIAMVPLHTCMLDLCGLLDCTSIARFRMWALHVAWCGLNVAVACLGSYKAATSLINVCCMGTTEWCVCAVLQVNGTEMPSGNDAEHRIHEHIAKIRQRDERIVIKFEGAAACVPTYVMATCIKTCVATHTKMQRRARVCTMVLMIKCTATCHGTMLCSTKQ